jgi:subtilase family serine protease
MIRYRRRPSRAHLSFDHLDERCLLSTLTPAQVASAYGFNNVSFNSNGSSVKGDGSGQTIAIVVAYHDPNLSSDLAQFDSQFGIAAPPSLSVTQDTSASDDGWATEESLDVEYAHAMAPAAKILVVEASSANSSDLLNAVNQARNTAGVSVVSMSWGAGEFYGESSYNSDFTTPSGHNGITFLAAAGDSGAGAEWPSVVPSVVSVGGTALTVTNTGAYGSESAWSSGGGGYSRYISTPSFQTGVNTSGARSTPDIAAVADPNTGVYVYATTPSTGQSNWYSVGGTSVATPVLSGLFAIANQGRALSGQGTLDSSTQTLSYLYQAPSTDFHDVTTGSNGYSATAGYDLATGLGSPNVPSLVAYLVNPTSSTSGTGTSGGTSTGTGGTSSGSGGTSTGGGGSSTRGHGGHSHGGWSWGWSWSGYYGYGGYYGYDPGYYDNFYGGYFLAGAGSQSLGAASVSGTTASTSAVALVVLPPSDLTTSPTPTTLGHDARVDLAVNLLY